MVIRQPYLAAVCAQVRPQLARCWRGVVIGQPYLGRAVICRTARRVVRSRDRPRCVMSAVTKGRVCLHGTEGLRWFCARNPSFLYTWWGGGPGTQCNVLQLTMQSRCISCLSHCLSVCLRTQCRRNGKIKICPLNSTAAIWCVSVPSGAAGY